MLDSGRIYARGKLQAIEKLHCPELGVLDVWTVIGLRIVYARSELLMRNF